MHNTFGQKQGTEHHRRIKEDAMEWVLIVLAVLYLLVLLRAFPMLLAPRCPLCGAHLESHLTEEHQRVWRRWHIGWRKFSCVQCLYYHNRPYIFRSIEEPENEPRPVQ
jgi:hypothetical protein